MKYNTQHDGTRCLRRPAIVAFFSKKESSAGRGTCRLCSSRDGFIHLCGSCEDFRNCHAMTRARARHVQFGECGAPAGSGIMLVERKRDRTYHLLAAITGAPDVLVTGADVPVDQLCGVGAVWTPCGYDQSHFVNRMPIEICHDGLLGAS